MLSGVYRGLLIHQRTPLLSVPTRRTKCHYQILGVSKTATSKELRKAYLDKAKLYHPDTNPDDATLHSKFLEIDEAYHAIVGIRQKGAGTQSCPNAYTYNTERYGANNEKQAPPPPSPFPVPLLLFNLLSSFMLFYLCCQLGVSYVKSILPIRKKIKDRVDQLKRKRQIRLSTKK